MTKINQKELQKILQNVGDCRFISIVAETIPSLKSPKTNSLIKVNGDSRIIKRSKVVISTGDSLQYKSVVNRRLEKVGEEPIIEIKPRKWGQRVPNTPFVINCGKLYLEALINQVIDIKYLFDGKEVSKEEISDKLLQKKESDVYNLGENKPIWRDFALTNIKEVTVNGKNYVVDNK